ncbi:MAG: LegC family aminotransferase [Candidatus Cloacimonetes bacterium]|nr:LegC family aminotransferase [Candidatus Cloacimonadota bacterium]
MYKKITDFIRTVYNTDDFIPLHKPSFQGNEKKYLLECIDSTYVSSVGRFVDMFEKKVADYTGAKKAVVTVNGTSALHLALILCGVKPDQEVLTQSLTFIATVNAISYTGAVPVFLDVDKETLGMSPDSLKGFLNNYSKMKEDGCYNKLTDRKIAACVPMHTFGHPVKIAEIAQICSKYKIELIEDAAESIGSKYQDKHTGLFGKVGIISFNGNKIITTGGGGMLITNDQELGVKAKHLSTQAKKNHRWEYDHDFTGYNYRMPNINAALGVAQLENLDMFIINKRELANEYSGFFSNLGIGFVLEPVGSYSNYWLNAILLENRQDRDNFLKYTNDNKIMTRPLWKPMHKLRMYENCYAYDLNNTEYIEERLVNIPSSVRI